jgi:hypothetical protein
MISNRVSFRIWAALVVVGVAAFVIWDHWTRPSLSIWSYYTRLATDSNVSIIQVIEALFVTFGLFLIPAVGASVALLLISQLCRWLTRKPNTEHDDDYGDA